MAKMPMATGELISATNILTKAGVGEKMKVADFGCGDTGYFIIPAAKLVGPQGVAYALDIQKSALDGVKNQAKIQDITNIEYVWTNLEIVGAAKIPDASLDSVLIINNLYQSKKRGEILREALRLLKIGGTLLAVDWKVIGTPFGPVLSLRVDPDEIKRLALSLGFKLKEEFEAGPYHYGLIFKKEI
jgi:ubiquinone/menaquinone biosynthesis C-methylase UbiE